MKQRGLSLENAFLDSSRPRSGSSNQRRREKRYLLAWTMLMTVLIAGATFSWIFCLYVFNHPEKPFSYKVLTKLERIEPPQRFDLYNVPNGVALEPKEMFARYLRYPQAGDDRLIELNDELLRNFVTNYAKAESVDYVSGTFRVFAIHVMNEESVFPQGIAVSARAIDCPDLTIEYLFPGEKIPADFFRSGDELTIEGNTAFATVINCAEPEQGKIRLTLVPLVYGTYSGPNGATVALDPPATLNLEGGWPAALNTPQDHGSQEPEQVANND